MTGRRRVAVVGGGPAGCVAALHLAAAGADVVVLEAAARPADRRLAGEWLHPPAVRILRRLGVELRAVIPHAIGHGFVVHPEDGTEPITLSYAAGEIAVSFHHRSLVEALHAAVRTHDTITFLTGAHVGRSYCGSVHYRDVDGSSRTVEADHVVGADGRSSTVRRSLGTPRRAGVMSKMAGLLLSNAHLPMEGYGHVILGGLGPMLVYRIDALRIRLCIDLPVDIPGPASTDLIRDRYLPRLPDSLAQSALVELGKRRVQWAANQFLPRTDFGRDGWSAIGDAAGQLHPVTAAGLAMAFQDARHLAQASTEAKFARQRRRQSRVPEMLSVALHGVFAGRDAGSMEMRQAVYSTWRASPSRRQRTMQLLSTSDVSVASFTSTFLSTVARAALDLKRSQGQRSGRTTVLLVAGLTRWAIWAVRAASRPRRRGTTATAVMPPSPAKQSVEAAHARRARYENSGKRSV